MQRHLHKKEFNVVAITVMVFEVLGFSVFLFGIIGAVYNMFFDPPLLTLWGFLILVLGATIISFFLLGVAELLQLLLKIEVNTRRTELFLEQREEPKKAVVAVVKTATKPVAKVVAKVVKKAPAKKVTKKVVRKK